MAIEHTVVISKLALIVHLLFVDVSLANATSICSLYEWQYNYGVIFCEYIILILTHSSYRVMRLSTYTEGHVCTIQCFVSWTSLLYEVTITGPLYITVFKSALTSMTTGSVHNNLHGNIFGTLEGISCITI